MKVKRDDNVGNQLDLSGISSDKEENDEIEDAVWNTVSDDKPTGAAESDNDLSLASLTGATN